jgi:hypothetical protein
MKALLPSTATQKAAVGHDTAVSPFPCGSMATGSLQLPWLRMTAFPELSTATQKVRLAQETALRPAAASVDTTRQLLEVRERKMLPLPSTA